MICHDKLVELLTYDPISGIFTWNFSRSGSGKTYKEAGHITNKGYRRIRVLGKNYFATRLAWFYMVAEWPPENLQVDHIDQNKLNNSWDNLRLATPEQNARNIEQAQVNSLTGIKGVTRKGNKFEANLYYDGVLHCLGIFSSAAEAKAEYDRMRDEIRT